MPQSKKLVTVAFFGLNAVRALSILTLLLLFASSVVTMANDIKAVNAFVAASKQSSSSNSTAEDCADGQCDYIEGSTVPNQPAGAFWAVMNRLLIIFQAIILILSEVGWPAPFFDSYFPVLGPNFGLGALGIIQGLLGAAVLSHHVDEFSLVAAFFLFSIACINMVLGLILRQKAKAMRSIRAWRAAKKGVLPNPATAAGPYPGIAPTYTGNSEKMSAMPTGGSTNSRAGMGFGRQGLKAAEAKGYFVQKPEEALPTYVPKRHASSSSSRASSPGP
ncbi:hypothetical protein QCA50_008191 [Cerrena zonata]|uniref:DUF7598 domain-containing protein n=1 Tax=Cerrena zonata TaxID=2478898 RepID=A0AAW0GEW7_9APHY